MGSLYRLKEAGERLWTHEKGREVRAEIEARLDALPAGEALTVSFEGVEVLDVSFSMEVFGKLYGGLSTAYPEKALVLQGLNSYVKTNLDTTLQVRNLIALIVDGPRKWELIGKASDTDRETMAVLAKRKQATAPEIADALGIQLTTCNQRLRKLSENGLIIRTKIAAASGGEQNMYKWPA